MDWSAWLGGRTPRPPAVRPPRGGRRSGRQLAVAGTRVRLRAPLGDGPRLVAPAGATGIVIGWDVPARTLSLELDEPHVIVTVPWTWVEDEPESPQSPSAHGR